MEIKQLRSQTSSINTFSVRYENDKEYIVNIVKQGDIKTVQSVSYNGVELDTYNENEDFIKNKILEAVEQEISKLDETKNSFYDDLREFKGKYPECYIECWTPEDYSSIKHDLENENENENENIDYPETNWSDELWINVSNKLEHDFDANNGTNWDRLKYVIQSLTAK